MPKQFIYARYSVKVYLDDTGEDLPEKDYDMLNDIIGDYMNDQVQSGLLLLLQKQFPIYNPKVEVEM